MITEDQELALVVQARRGSSQALATLLQANYDVLYRYLVKLTMSPGAAEDVAQDAMERAVRSFASFDPDKARFSTWLIAVARNRWLDELRRNRRLQPLPEAAEDTPAAQDPYSELIQRDELLNALGHLNIRARTPITMRYLLGYSNDEIAGFLKIPLGTVKSRIFNALKQLRKELDRNDG